MLRITNPVLFVFEAVVALTVACAIHAALAHNYADCLWGVFGAGLLAGTMAITKTFRPEIFEHDER